MLGHMKKFLSIADILANEQSPEEVYTTDKKKRYWRSQKGYYTKSDGVFSFIHLMQKWPEIVGDFMAANTLPLKIKQKTLFISSKHSIFAQELGFLAPKIIEKINDAFPSFEGGIQRIKFVHNDFQAVQQTHTKQTQAPSKPKLHPHSPQYKILVKKADELIADIEDEDVREALKKFILS